MSLGKHDNALVHTHTQRCVPMCLHPSERTAVLHELPQDHPPRVSSLRGPLWGLHQVPGAPKAEGLGVASIKVPMSLYFTLNTIRNPKQKRSLHYCTCFIVFYYKHNKEPPQIRPPSLL